MTITLKVSLEKLQEYKEVWLIHEKDYAQKMVSLHANMEPDDPNNEYDWWLQRYSYFVGQIDMMNEFLNDYLEYKEDKENE